MALTDLRNLPDTVLNRLDGAPAGVLGRSDRGDAPGLDVVIAGAHVGGVARAEQRHQHDPQLAVTRADDDGATTARHVGYALVYDFAYDVAGGPPWGWIEEIAAGACSGCLRDDVRYLLNHDGMPMARTVNRTLIIDDDNRGLHSDATVDLRQQVASDLTIAIERGDIDQMSFAFRVARQEWNDDYTHRRILEFEQLYDTSTVTYPANPATLVKVPRSATVDELAGRRREFERHAAAVALDL